MESGNRTAEQLVYAIFENRNFIGTERKELIGLMESYASQQCEALQSENERLLERVKELQAMLKICRLEIKTAYELDGIKDDRILKHIDSLLNPKE
jgi:hypothetical protein